MSFPGQSRCPPNAISTLVRMGELRPEFYRSATQIAEPRDEISGIGNAGITKSSGRLVSGSRLQSVRRSFIGSRVAAIGFRPWLLIWIKRSDFGGDGNRVGQQDLFLTFVADSDNHRDSDGDGRDGDRVHEIVAAIEESVRAVLKNVWALSEAAICGANHDRSLGIGAASMLLSLFGQWQCSFRLFLQNCRFCGRFFRGNREINPAFTLRNHRELDLQVGRTGRENGSSRNVSRGVATAFHHGIK